MNDWIAAVQAELGLNVSFDTDAILDAARDAAHATERKAAPITTATARSMILPRMINVLNSFNIELVL